MPTTAIGPVTASKRPPGRPRLFSNEDVEFARRMRAQGITRAKISAVLGCTEITVTRMLLGQRKGGT